ncbi:MAG: transferase [Myxococcales bacterium]|nr:transferase [Myxococcales bacterium]
MSHDDPLDPRREGAHVPEVGDKLPPPRRPVPTAPPDGKTNQNPKDISFWELVREDFRTHDSSLAEPGFWALFVHRFGNARMDLRPRILRMPVSLLYRAMRLGVLWGWGIQLNYTVKVGRRVRIWHHGGMVFGAAEIGDDVHLRQNTTFGSARLDQRFAKPVIESRVDVGTGAVILGHVTVGHDSVIAANAVVTGDVPPYAVVGGVPARILKYLRPDQRSERSNRRAAEPSTSQLPQST